MENDSDPCCEKKQSSDLRKAGETSAAGHEETSDFLSCLFRRTLELI